MTMRDITRGKQIFYYWFMIMVMYLDEVTELSNYTLETDKCNNMYFMK